MGDTGILVGLIGYFVVLQTFLAAHGDLDFKWSPPGPDVGTDKNATHEQGFISNALECSFKATGSAVAAVLLPFNADRIVARLGAACSRETVSIGWTGIDAFFEGLTTVVQAVFAAFTFMIAALRTFWDLLKLDIPGPGLLNALIVWVPAGALGFMIYRQIRGVGG